MQQKINMEAKELRIGNLIRTEVVGKDIDSESICEVSAYLFGTYLQTDIDKFSGIPLTEEWITKLRFTKSSERMNYFTKDNCYAVSTLDDKIVFIQGNFICQLILCELKYIHQLQNLYFALTGEELTLNE